MFFYYFGFKFGNVQATKGKQFMEGKAAATAATMSKDDRLSFVGYAYNIATDFTIRDTKVNGIDSQGLTTGR